MKALVVNALGHGFDLEDIDIAAPMGREVLIDVQASGLCHTDPLFATHDIVAALPNARLSMKINSPSCRRICRSPRRRCSAAALSPVRAPS
jgi:hypothetical protein